MQIPTLISLLALGSFPSPGSCYGDMFSSMADLELLLETEKTILTAFQTALVQEREKLQVAQQYVRQLRKSAPTARNPSKYSQEISQEILREIPLLLHSDGVADATAIVASAKAKGGLPNEDDLLGAAEAFQMLQQTYQIPTQSIINGQIAGTRQTVPLLLEDIFVVGFKLIQANHFQIAAVWLDTAKRMMEKNDPVVNVELYTAVLDWLHYALFKHTKNALRSLTIAEKIQAVHPAFPSMEEKIAVYRQVRDNATEEERVHMEATLSEPITEEEDRPYDQLCRGERSPEENPEYSCRLVTHGNPFLLLQPAKIETVHIDPDIYLIHDVILPSQADRMRQFGYPKLRRGRTFYGSDRVGTVTNVRVAKKAFIAEDYDPIMKITNYYAGAVVNLDVTKAEDLQIVNYGIGGRFVHHFDYEGREDPESNNTRFSADDFRMVSLIAYISDVEAGGATVFPLLDVAVYPKKGMGVMWYNIMPDGQQDQRTLHSGCPVLSGNKWIANKFFRERGQDRWRPCGLEPDASYQIYLD